MMGKCEYNVSVLCPFSFGIALGVTKGLCMMFFFWSAYLWGYGLPFVDTLSQLYAGTGPTLFGGLIGFLWGFLIGFIFGAVLAFIYDMCVCCKCKKAEHK
jgi:hypothetical protein